MARRRDPRKAFELLAKFGNDWALRQAEARLRELGDVEVIVRDRRTLRVIARNPRPGLRDDLRDLIRSGFGYVDEELEVR